MSSDVRRPYIRDGEDLEYSAEALEVGEPLDSISLFGVAFISGTFHRTLSCCGTASVINRDNIQFVTASNPIIQYQSLDNRPGIPLTWIN